MAARESSGFASTEWDNELDIPMTDLYQTTVRTSLTRHMTHVRDHTENILPTPTLIAKQKLKSLMGKHSTELLSFLSPDQDSILHRAHRSLAAQGADVPAVDTLDTGLDAAYSAIEEELSAIAAKRTGCAGVAVYVEQTRWLVSFYKMIGEEVLRLETVLYEKLESLDTLQCRVPLLMALKDHATLHPVLDAFQAYAEQMFKESKIEETYRVLLEKYKSWHVARQIITSYHTMYSQEPKCGICIDRTVDHVIVPCGHTVCRDCVNKMGSRCFLCRGEAKQKIRLYFG